ncbi:MAG TPA: monofunctional biosynthetic peptidoglycan transglycosylase, partial [Hyphomicrobium sp.]|nr:monofunctional biosynthetic peptidoglycan transglycosylase [Hyphomicrobium sp.]
PASATAVLPAGMQTPSAPTADPYARLEPSFSQPRAQEGFLAYRPRPEPSWSSPTAAETVLPAPDLAQEPPAAPDPWATFGSATLEKVESRRVPPAFGMPSDQLSSDRTSDMTAAMGASSSFAPMTAVVPDTVAEPARTQRDWRDVLRRIAHAAFLIFAGWFIAVLALIVAYRFVNPPFSMLMAQQFLSGTPIQKQWVPLEQISPNLRRAVIVSEDGRFCRHWGVDLVEAANALKRASDGYPRGASTITMQVAKNLFLLPTKSYVRKVIELPLTFAIELAWPKARILEIYLNIVEWGPGIFGAEAASQAHFRRSSANLTPRQAAQLAVALPNPIVRNAGRPGPQTARKASVIQKRAAGARSASSCVDTVR